MNLKIKKIRSFSKDFWQYAWIAIKAFPISALVIPFIPLKKGCDIIVCKFRGKVIGGMLLSKIPYNMYRPKNLLNKKRRTLLQNFIKKGYRYLTCVVIKKEHRKRGFGRQLFIKAQKHYSIKSYFTPETPKLQSFYLKVRAKIFRTKCGKTIEGIKSPIMIFD